MLHQWKQGNASQHGSSSSFIHHKEGADNAANIYIWPQRRKILSSKLFWFLTIMAILLLGLVLGLALGLTQAKNHPPPPSPAQPTKAAGQLPRLPDQSLGPVIDLGYTSIQGLCYPAGGISQWLGIRYAKPPVGNLRFAEPQNVTAGSGPKMLQMATQVSLPSLPMLISSC